jgi:hypothetical protein
MPKREKSREKEAGEARGFRVRTALLIVTLTALAVFYPILAGYVPFPADTVLSFPPWATHAKTICIGTSHAEMGDIVTQFYPWHSTLNAKLRKFEIPLWNQHVLMGTPFEAQPATGVFFPLNWAFAIVSAPSAWAWLFIIRTVIIGISTTLYLSRLEISAAGAMVSGLTFAFCGWVTAFQGRPQLDTAMWLPLMFLAVDYVREVPSRRSIALAAVAFALPVLGGHPEIAAQVILAGTCYALYRTFRASPGRVRYVGAFGVAAALSAMLAAVQIVPTFEWLGYIPRSLSNHWGALAPGQIIAFLSPDISRHPNVDGVSVPEAAAYAGTFGLAVLPFALFWRKRGDVVFFAALAAACIEIVYGWPPAYWISQHLPVLAGLPNWRFLVVADFCIAVLAGIAVSALQDRCGSVKPTCRPATTAIPVFAALIGCGTFLVRILEGHAVRYQWTVPAIAAGVAIAGLAATRRISARLFTTYAAVAVLADMVTFSFGYMPFVRPADIFPANAVFDFLRAHAGGTRRVGAVDVAYGNNFEIPYGLAAAGGYDFPTRRIARFLSTFSLNPLVISFHSERLVHAPKGALDLTGARYYVATQWNSSAVRLGEHPNRFHRVLTAGMLQIFENPDAMPLAFFVPAAGIEVLPNQETEWTEVLSESFDPRRTVTVPSSIERYAGARSSAAFAEVERIAVTTNAVEVSASAKEDGLLVLDETYYPGWTARVDGASAPVIRADYAFMAVPVARGTHVVRFEFLPTTFRIGAIASAIASGALICLLLFRNRNRDTTGTRPSRKPDTEGIA